MKTRRRRLTKQRRSEQGWALTLTLALAVTLAIIAATIYVEGMDNQLISKAEMEHEQAVSRADQAAQYAITQLRANGSTWATSLPPCANLQACIAQGAIYDCYPNAGTITCGTALNPLNATTGSLATGGGLTWDAKIYRISGASGSANNAVPVFAIVATGYYGFSNSPNLISSEVDAELALQATVGTPQTGYPPYTSGGYLGGATQ
jgi:hypothetical protein